MKNAILKWIPLMVLLVPMQARAAPITYDIVFTASSWNRPTAAEFTYDARTSTLTGLSVTWNGFTFDKFAFSERAGRAPGEAGPFNMLMMAAPTDVSYSWRAVMAHFGEEFTFFAHDKGGWRPVAYFMSYDDYRIFGPRGASGPAWTSIPRAPPPGQSVPEPGTLALLGLGLAGLGFTRRRRQTTQV